MQIIPRSSRFLISWHIRLIKRYLGDFFFNRSSIITCLLGKLIGQSFTSLLNIYRLKQQNVYLVDSQSDLGLLRAILTIRRQ